LIAFRLILKELGFNVPASKILTASSVCIHTFKRNFNNTKETPLMQIPLKSTLHIFVRKTYIGGRVEVFNRGLGMDKVYHFDVPGLYANMITKPLPIGNPL
jgi:hypothetical protein